jgi:FkbM family methyltransferase
MQPVRRTLRNWLHRTTLALGFRLVRAPRWERALRRWELDQDDFYFIQIGAHNGVTSDPFQRFVAEGHWTCLLVEPQPPQFQILQAIYCNRPGVQCRNVAIGTANGRLPMFSVRPDAPDLPYWASQLASMRYDAVASHADQIPNLLEFIEQQEIPCLTLSTLVDSLHWPRIDLLATDTEGYDFEVVKQIDALPTTLWPKFVYYEHLHLPAEEYAESLEFLRQRGYQPRAVNAGDTFAIRRD